MTMTVEIADTIRRRRWSTAIGSLIFVLGITVALFLLLKVTSAQIETAMSDIGSGDTVSSDIRESLEDIACPAAVGPDGSAEVHFKVTNPADSEQTAQIPVFVGSPDSAPEEYLQQCEPAVTFGPGETRTLTCEVSATGIGGTTLMVEVPGIAAHCGIAIIDGPGGLDGMTALAVGFGLSLAGLLLGGGLWFLFHVPHRFFEWLRRSLGVMVIALVVAGAGCALLVDNAFWKMIVSVGAFWGALLLTVGLLILLAAEGIVMRMATRKV